METSASCEEPDDVMKQRFYTELKKNRITAGKNAVFLTDERYEQLVDEVKNAKTAIKKVPRHYWLLNKYDVMVVEQRHKLIKPVEEGCTNVQFYVSDSELFDVIYKMHISIGHCGRDRLIKELSPKYKNITRHDIELFLQLCIPCQHKLKGNKKGTVRPLISSEFDSRCQVNLIDFQSCPDGEKKYILVYQDFLTKFIVLKALKSKHSKEVAFNLIDIFTLIGAPSILQSNIGQEFSSEVVLDLKQYWSQLKIVSGKSYSQNQKRVEYEIQDIQNMLNTWMQEEKCNRWTVALRFIQLMKNQSYHTGIKMSPYEALFGYRIKIGLNTSNLPPEMLENIKSEEELQEIVKLAEEPNAYSQFEEEDKHGPSTTILLEISQAECQKIKSEPEEAPSSSSAQNKPDMSLLIEDKTQLALSMNNKNLNSLDFYSPSPLSSELLLQQSPMNNNDLHSTLFSSSEIENQITHELAQTEAEIRRRTLLMSDHYNRKVRQEAQKDLMVSNMTSQTFQMTSQTNTTDNFHQNLQIQPKKNLPTGERSVAKAIRKAVDIPTHSYVIHKHQGSMLSNMADLWKKGKLCDASIGNGTMKIMVHKIVLVALSPQLLSLPDTDLMSGCFQVTFPQEIGGDALWAFAKYMYEGVVSLNADVLLDMERISVILNLQDLQDMCNLYRDQVNLPSQSFTVNNNSTTDIAINSNNLQHPDTSGSTASGVSYFSLPSGNVTQTVSKPVQHLQILSSDSNDHRLSYSRNLSSPADVKLSPDDRPYITISPSDSDSDLTIVSSNVKREPSSPVSMTRYQEKDFLPSVSSRQSQGQVFVDDDLSEPWQPHTYGTNVTNPPPSKQMKLSSDLERNNPPAFKIEFTGLNQKANDVPYPVSLISTKNLDAT